MPGASAADARGAASGAFDFAPGASYKANE
jgi:hypothetical protein